MSTTRIYIQCNGGDYFDGTACPLDGWSSPEVEEIANAAARVASMDRPLSVEHLRAAGLSEAALRRVVVIEFGDEQAAFEALTPAGYIIDGEWVPVRKVGRALK